MNNITKEIGKQDPQYFIERKKMKKILFCLPQMLGRGVEKSFLTLVSQLPEKEYNITVLFVEMRGEFVPFIPEYIIKGEIPMDETMRYDASHDISTRYKIFRSIKKGKFREALGMFYRKAIKHDPLGGFTKTFDQLPRLDENYDMAICYHVHNPFLIRYISDVVNAKVKMAWIHNDFVTTQFPIEKYERELSLYDRIFGVSRKIVQEFSERLPNLSDRIFYFENIVDFKEMEEKAGDVEPSEYNKYHKGKKIILTVGALTEQKGIDIALETTKQMVEDGISDFIWFILGIGIQYDELKERVEKYGLQSNFILCGHRDNPYPYFKFCDIYVQPSRHEGYGIALAEARAFCRPCVATDFAGAREQLEDGITGSIVRCEIGELKTEIIKLLNSEELRKKYSDKLRVLKKEKETSRVSLLTELLIE